MKIYAVLSRSIDDPIGRMFARDPSMRKFRLTDGAKIGDILVRDVDSAAKAFADLLAKRDFGKGLGQSA